MQWFDRSRIVGLLISMVALGATAQEQDFIDAITSEQKIQAAVPGQRSQQKKDLVIAVSSAAYGDQINMGLKPILERKGYKIRVQDMAAGGGAANAALGQGQIDADLVQSGIQLARVTSDGKLKLTEVVRFPTAPTGIYSRKFRLLTDLKEGASVALPSEAYQQGRALRLLEQMGWLRLRDGADPAWASDRDITANPKRIRLVPYDSSTVVRVLDSSDFVVADGAVAWGAGLKLGEALVLEKTTAQHLTALVVRAEDKDKPWVRDLVEAVRSREFLATADRYFGGFVRP
jgi:D-methionine transport system substrate-binding protein